MRNRIPILLVLAFVQIVTAVYLFIFTPERLAATLVTAAALPLTLIVLFSDMIAWIRQITRNENEVHADQNLL